MIRPAVVASIFEIRRLLQPVWAARPEIDFVYLFGSLARGKPTPARDIDLAVHARVPSDARPGWKLALWGEISDAVASDKIDLVHLNATDNVMLLDEIVRDGVVLFERDEEVRKLFDVRVIHDGIDFKEHRRRYLGV